MDDNSLFQSMTPSSSDVTNVTISLEDRRYASRQFISYVHCILQCLTIACCHIPNGFIHLSHWIILPIIMDIPCLLLLQSIFGYYSSVKNSHMNKIAGIRAYMIIVYTMKTFAWLSIFSEIVRTLFIDCCSLASINFYVVGICYTFLMIISSIEIFIIYT